MSDLKYLNKRDEKGVLLYYSAYELAYAATNSAIKFINSTKVYDLLTTTFPQKYIDLYYMKMIYEAFSPIAHQLVIYKYDKQHHKETKIPSIDANGFPCQPLLREIWPDNNIDFSISYSSKIRNRINDRLYPLLNRKNKLNNILNPLSSRSNNIYSQPLIGANIAVNYVEGFDLNKRSDLFWFNGSAIDPKSVVVYYKSPYLMTRHDAAQKAIDVFSEYGIVQVKLWQWYHSKKSTIIDNQVTKLKSIQATDDIEFWLKRSAINLCKRSNFWLKFFHDYKIKIHLDPIEYGLEAIIKQIAITLLGGVSIGKIRSHPIGLKGIFFGYYPNDVFFSWSTETGKRINSTNQHIENIIVSGFSYGATNKTPRNETVAMEAKFKSNDTKFNILLLDSNHSHNEGLSQLIETSTMSSFYWAFLDWVLEDVDIGVIIKPKKSQLLTSLPGVINYLEKVEKKTGRCLLIKDSFQKMPSSYLKGIDMVVGTGVFFSSAVVECVIHGARGIFYDYPNLRYHEPGLYSWGENNVIFPDFDSMISALKGYKNDPSSNPHLGDWSAHLDELDPFRDMRGGERIGTYMRWLQEAFDQGLEREDAIEQANALYAEAWGEDKIFYSEGNKRVNQDRLFPF